MSMQLEPERTWAVTVPLPHFPPSIKEIAPEEDWRILGHDPRREALRHSPRGLGRRPPVKAPGQLARR